MMNGMSGMGPMMWLVMLLVWGFAILGLGLAIRWVMIRGWGDREEEQQSPLEVLKARYARGEIDREEFERMKKELK